MPSWRYSLLSSLTEAKKSVPTRGSNMSKKQGDVKQLGTCGQSQPFSVAEVCTGELDKVMHFRLKPRFLGFWLFVVLNY